MTSNADYGRPYRRRRDELESPFGRPCPFCRRPMLRGERLQTDHAVPKALGGADSPLRWAHGPCNEAAGARLGNKIRGRRSGRKWVDRWV